MNDDKQTTMAKTIYKYVPSPDGTEMPRGAEVLSVQLQRGILTLWALVDPEAPVERRAFAVYGTGHGVREGAKHLATLQEESGLVWHVFEVTR